VFGGFAALAKPSADSKGLKGSEKSGKQASKSDVLLFVEIISSVDRTALYE
jgi:hypothetical protein